MANRNALLRSFIAMMLIATTGCLSDLSGRGGGPAVVIEPGRPVDNVAAKPPKINKPVAGEVLIAGGVNSKLKSDAHAEFFNPTTKKFVVASPLKEDRIATVGIESSGKVTIFSGINGSATLSRTKGQLRVLANVRDDAEVYDPATGLFSIAANKPVTGAAFYTATPLSPGGKILIAGGLDGTYTPTDAAEIFDPSDGSFTAVPNGMNYARAYHTATLLNDGTVLIVGGSLDALGNTEPTGGDTGAEIYDPAKNSFSRTTGSLPTFESGFGVSAHTATLLSDGKVLIAGGYSNFGDSTVTTVNNTGVIYDPSTQTFTALTSTLTDARAFHTATMLSNGHILFAGGLGGDSTQAIPVAGGVNGIFGGIINSAELYDPANQTFSCIGGPITIRNLGPACKGVMKNSRGGHSATLFTSGPLVGQVLLAGGVGSATRTTRGAGAPLATAELYNPATGKFTATGKMTTARALFAAVLLQ
jgi:Kelch motif